MVHDDPRSTKIVRSYPGQGTAETVYETDDGRVWRSGRSVYWPSTSTGSGPMIGEIRNNRIFY